MSPERSLWLKVLMTVHADLTSRGVQSQPERTSAERWVGAFPSREFCTVCALCGLDPHVVHAWLKAIVDLPIERRGKSLFFAKEADHDKAA